MAKTGKKLKRFVIHKHTRQGQIHWDLMLEAGDVLETYRVTLPPARLVQLSGESAIAVKIDDHPHKFLTYEGPVNQGKGQVTMADRGEYEVLEKGPALKKLCFKGAILKGIFTLTQISGDQWQLAGQQVQP